MRPPTAGPGLVQVVAAAKELAAGVPLTNADVTVIGWPANVSLPGSVSKPEDVIGRPLRFSVSANQPILQRDLGAAGSGLGLASKIPPGMRATTVRSNEVVGVAGFLFPGSRVDVLATYTAPVITIAGKDVNAPTTTGGSQTTQTVLQNVEVLATGTATEPDPQGRAQTVNVVTLLLSPEDSQKLLLASSQGTIQFVLRSNLDQDRPAIAPTSIEHLTSNAPVPQPAVTETPRPAPRPVVRTEPVPQAPVTAPPPPPKPPEPHVIEVIQGTARTTQSFAQDKTGQ